MRFQVYVKIVASILTTGLLLATCGTAAAAATAPDSIDGSGGALSAYELGHGLPLGNSGFTVGGYSSLQGQNVQNSNSRASLSHLSMFVWWENESRLKFFSEIDSKDLLSADEQSEADNHRYLSIERLYFEYSFSDALTLRAGKYLTPIGHWNQLHADPLVWTTSRPLITTQLFPDNATGAMALGNIRIFGRQADYTLYTSVGTDIRPDPAQAPFNDITGARLNVHASENMQIGISYAGFDQRTAIEEEDQLLGLDFLWSDHGYELSGEGAYRKSSAGPQRSAKGGFIQGVMPLYNKLFAVARVESINNPDMQGTTRLWVMGLNYRQNRAISFKLEFIHGFHQSISAAGFLSSISVLF
ncbi:MAG TPA: hypothetical protein VNX00_10685 [Herbaspirillum sp.]|nr:hypothetical protein [Herbaspirillum sp.]